MPGLILIQVPCFTGYIIRFSHLGAIKLNFPHLEVWEMDETCALDVAGRGGITLEEVGEIMNLTRERIRQVEVRGLIKLKLSAEDGGLVPNG